MYKVPSRLNDKLRQQLAAAVASGSLKPVTVAEEIARVKSARPAAKSAPVVERPKLPPRQKIETSLEKAMAVCMRIVLVNGMIPGDATMERMETIRGLVHPLGAMFGQSRTKEALDLRRAAEACQNYVSTVAQGIQENDIDPPMLASVVSRLREYIVAVLDAYKAADDRANIPVVEAVTETLTAEKISKFRTFKAKLGYAIKKAQEQSTLTNTRPVFVRMPVLVLFDPNIPTPALAAQGFPVEGYDGMYNIVLNQMVIGVPSDAEDRDEMLNFALGELRKEHPSYDYVSNKSTGVPKHSMIFYWVATRELHTLMSSGDRSISVATWSFPF